MQSVVGPTLLGTLTSVDGQLHPNELNILLAAVGNVAILHRQEDVCVLGRRRVLVHIPVDAMKAKDGEAAEVVPRILKKT